MKLTKYDEPVSILQAIKQAAEHIKANPDCYNFWTNDKPKSLKGCGCALGWTGYFLGVKSVKNVVNYTDTVARKLGHKDMVDAVHKLANYNILNAKSMAKALLDYGRKYHKAA